MSPVPMSLPRVFARGDGEGVIRETAGKRLGEMERAEHGDEEGGLVEALADDHEGKH